MFWVLVLSYISRRGWREAGATVRKISFAPPGWDAPHLPWPGWDTRLDVRKLPRCCTATDYVTCTYTFGYTELDHILLHLSIM